jgi:hypothetical protein
VAVPEKNYTFSYGDRLTPQHAEELAVEFVNLAKQRQSQLILSLSGFKQEYTHHLGLPVAELFLLYFRSPSYIFFLIITDQTKQTR